MMMVATGRIKLQDVLGMSVDFLERTFVLASLEFPDRVFHSDLVSITF